MIINDIKAIKAIKQKYFSIHYISFNFFKLKKMIIFPTPQKIGNSDYATLCESFCFRCCQQQQT